LAEKDVLLKDAIIPTPIANVGSSSPGMGSVSNETIPSMPLHGKLNGRQFKYCVLS
jgi:hypothetical protein